MGQNTVATFTTTHLQELLITVQVITIEKVPFSDTNILRLFVTKLTADDTHYLLNRGNLMPLIQMQLSQKQRTFSQFFFCILNIYIKF